MSVTKVTFRILRYKPDLIDPPRFQNYPLRTEFNMSVLDGLERIRLEQDDTLMYRHSCHHSSCGTCACRINGEERLTCITKIADLHDDPITITPLEGFKPIGDLVVDMTRFYKDYSEEWRYIRRSEKIKHTCLPSGINHFTRFENCIECGACISACPVIRNSSMFLGPALLSAVNNELRKSPQKSEDLLSTAGSKHGEQLCESAVRCSRVCPTKVYPARHIADLRRLLKRI
jgi:succinate dehydrogenase iron-sulfur subunit